MKNITNPGDSFEVLVRRKAVYDAKAEHGDVINIPALATALKVSVRVIYEDLEWIRNNIKRFLKTFDEEWDIGNYFLEMKSLKEKCWAQYRSTEDTRSKLIVIRMIDDLNERIKATKLELGLWSRHQGSDIKDKSFEAKIIELRKQNKLLPEPKESIIAKKIREMKNNKEGGGNNK